MIFSPNQHLLIVILLLFLPIYAQGFSNSTTETQTGKYYLQQLYSDHLTDYDVRIRPRYNQSETLNISVLLFTSGVTEFDTAVQTFTFLVYFSFQWKDEFLTWHPPDYGSITRMKLPKSQIWSPDMNVEVTNGNIHYIGHTTDKAVVLSSGMVTWTPRSLLSVMCNVRIKYYPFDVQTCVFIINVPDEASNEVRLETKYEFVTPPNFLENHEWETLGIVNSAEEFSNLSYISYEWTLKRRPSFIIYTIVLPLLIMSVMNIGIVLVPIGSGEKGSMAMTLFLSYGVFLSSISDSIPHNSSENSLFVIYICILLIFSGVTVFYTVIQSIVYFRMGQSPVKFRLLQFINGKCKKNEINQTYDDIDKDGNERTTDSRDDYTRDAHNGDEKLTWEKLMSTFDLILFCVLLVIDSISTVIFFIYMSK